MKLTLKNPLANFEEVAEYRDGKKGEWVAREDGYPIQLVRDSARQIILTPKDTVEKLFPEKVKGGTCIGQRYSGQWILTTSAHSMRAALKTGTNTVMGLVLTNKYANPWNLPCEKMGENSFFPGAGFYERVGSKWVYISINDDYAGATHYEIEAKGPVISDKYRPSDFTDSPIEPIASSIDTYLDDENDKPYCGQVDRD